MPTNNNAPIGGSTEDHRISVANERVRKQLSDALDLANYAIESGAKTANGDALPFDDIGTIQLTAAKLGVLSNSTDGGSLTPSEWNDFGLAYYRLAAVMNPVTAETLRDTEGTSRHSTWQAETSDQASTGDKTASSDNSVRNIVGRVSEVLFGFSPAQRFARGLWLVAIGFAAFVVLAELRIFMLGQEADVNAGLQAQRQFLNSLIPWAYGGLGSCAYLLRSAHMYIYRRSFDLRRKPEYFSRILLGSISGGAIILFTKYLVDEEGTVVQLSSAALGFIAGYSTDFLFNTIERIVSAIFPKVAVENVPPPSATTRTGGVLPKPDNSRTATDTNSGSGEGAETTDGGKGETETTTKTGR